MRLNIDLDKLKIFYYVARAKKFTVAAEALNISQSALSRSIQLLEDRLGIKLFYRHARGLTLTAQGEIMAPIIGRFLNEIENATEKLYEEEKEPKGPLRVVANKGLTDFYILPYIAKFFKLYPEIRLTLKITDTMPSLEFGEAHVIIRPPIHGPDGEGLLQEHLLTNHTGLYASQDYLNNFGVPEKPEDLDHHQLIAYGDHIEAEPFKAMNFHLTIGTEHGNRREPCLQVNSVYARCMLAKQGLGIIALSKEHPGLKELGLIQILHNVPLPTVESYYIYPKELENSKKVIAFRDYLKEAFTKNYGEKRKNIKIV